MVRLCHMAQPARSAKAHPLSPLCGRRPRAAQKLKPGGNPFRAAIDEQFTDTTWTGLRTRDYLREFAKQDKPFFLFSSFWKPHSPFEVPAPFDSLL